MYSKLIAKEFEMRHN